MRAPIYHIENKDYTVSILVGAAEELVRRRDLRKVYETNRDIKIWSSWFLLKTISPNSSFIEHWIKQKDIILDFLKLNENTFRRQLKEMVRLGLATVDHYNITLTSYIKAADVLGIAFNNTYSVTYNPSQYEGKQVFRYLLTAEEFKERQERQLGALMNHMDKNPTLRNDIVMMLHQHGADERYLNHPRYFQERLLQLQLQLFRKGSDLLSYIYTHRADINRGVKCIAKHYSYKSSQSVSYLKKRMAFFGIISVQKLSVASENRSRLYVPGENGKQRDGYKWLSRAKITALFLTDQITFNHEKKKILVQKKAA